VSKEETILPQKSKKLKVLKFIGIATAGAIAVVIIVITSLTMIYPAILRSAHRIDNPYGIDSMEVVEIGGISQTLHFRGQDIGNPAILFLHGGPGSPSIPLLHDFQFELEHYFTIVHWDQRNAGKTYLLNNPAEVLETLTFERVLVDTYEVVQFIKNKLAVEQVIIVGYSWGSVLGTAFVQAYPQYVSAYIAIGQNVNSRENKRLSFEALLEAAQASGDSRHIAAVEALGHPPQGKFGEEWVSYITNLQILSQRHGFSADLFQFAQLIMTSPYYTLGERINFLTSGADRLRYQMPLLEFMFDENFDIRNFGIVYEVPVFYIMGELDRQTSYQLAKEFFEEIYAPFKSFFSIPNAGHAPMHENTAEFNRVLIEEIRPFFNNVSI